MLASNIRSIHMDKIKQLLKEMGISEEISKEFISTCEGWLKTERVKLNEEFDARLNKAKQVCVEEVATHKANLSRGVQLFLESRIENIKKAGQKQLANEESEVISKFKQLKALLEGINVDEAAASKELQAVKKDNDLLKKQVTESVEAMSQLKAKAAKLADISEKSFARQKLLESKLAKAETDLQEAVAKTAKVVSEEKAPLAESAKKEEPVVKEAKTDLNKEKVVSEAPKTTKPVVKEERLTPRSETDIDQIAESL